MVRGFIPDRLRSSRKTVVCGFVWQYAIAGFGAATQPVGDKSPHHRVRSHRISTVFGRFLLESGNAVTRRMSVGKTHAAKAG